MRELPIQLGEMIVGRYFVEGVLGEGGWATVYAALDRERNDKEVAVKVMHSRLALDGSFR